MEFGDINEIIKEFLKYNGYKTTLESFEAEEKAKMVSNKLSKKNLNIVPKVNFIYLFHRIWVIPQSLDFIEFSKLTSLRPQERRS